MGVSVHVLFLLLLAYKSYVDGNTSFVKSNCTCMFYKDRLEKRQDATNSLHVSRARWSFDRFHLFHVQQAHNVDDTEQIKKN